MKYNNKLFFVVLFFLLSAVLCFAAFEWPQKNVTVDSFDSDFGQERGGVLSTSLIFSEPAEISVAKEGTVLALIGGNSGELGWFDSPLGNAVILAHADEMLTVYANIKELEIDTSAKYVQAGKTLGVSGGSGWQKGRGCLEFQVIDTQKDAVINPRILMPHMQTEKSLRLQGIILVNRTTGDEYDLRIRRSLPAGNYTLYRTQTDVSFPYRTTVSVNGAAVETITFDVLNRLESSLVVKGKRSYSSKEVFPDDSRQLLAELSFAQGRNTLNIAAQTINGTETSLTYILDVR